MKHIRFFNIQWDKDGQHADLPQEETIQVETGFDVDSDGADLLSDRHGFCLFGFNFEEVSK